MEILASKRSRVAAGHANAHRRDVLRLLAGATAGLGVAGVGGAAARAEDANIKIGGTGGALGVLRELSDAIQAGGHAMRLEIVPSLGSSGGIRALIAGAIDAAVSGRELTSAEASRGIHAVPLGDTPFCFVTSYSAGGNLSRSDIKRVYAGEMRNWPDGTPVRVILRPESDSAAIVLVQHLPELAPVLAAARRAQFMPVAPTDQDNADAATQTPGSFATMGLAQLNADRLQLRALSYEGVAPSIQNLEAGAYPFGQRIYLVVRQPMPSAVQAFVSILQSTDSMRVLRDAGMCPAS